MRARIGPAAPPLLLLAPAVLCTAAFIVLPLLCMGIFSFWTQTRAGVVLRVFTLANWREYLGDPFYVSILVDTLRLAATTTALCALIGYPTAYALTLIGPRWKSLLIILLFLPSWISYVVRTMSWLYVLGKNGLLNSALIKAGVLVEPVQFLYNDVTVHLGLVHYLLPLMIVNIYIALQSVDKNVVAAARTLGATEWQAFLAVTFPLSLPGIGAGCLLCFVLGAGTYITPLVLGGAGSTYYSQLIYQSVIRQLNWGFGATVSLVFVFVLALVVTLYVRVAGLSHVFKEIK
ncbi:MAG: ABC transporter permease [Alphaproteobacteria bacterium]|nr:ABC transporter permease [Alphaproteobacteria bacterium]